MKLILFMLVALAAVQGATAMFEDQAGTYDWYRQHIGLISSASFHPSKPRVCFATAQSVVGCLNLRDGSLAWRKALGSSISSPSSLLLPKSSSFVTVTEGYLRAFDLEGNLLWQRKVPGSTAVPSLAGLAASDDTQERILLLQNGELQLLDPSDGTVLGTEQVLSALGKPAQIAVGSGSRGFVFAVGSGSNEAVLVDFQDPTKGQLGRKMEVESQLSLSDVVSASANTVAALSHDGKAICVAPVLGAESPVRLTCTQLSELVPELPASVSLRVDGTSGGYVVFGNPGAALLAADEQGGLKLVKYFPAAISVSPEIRADDGGFFGVLEGSAPGGGLKLSVVRSSNGEVIQVESFPSPTPSERLVGPAPVFTPSGFVLGTFVRKKDKSMGFRALVSFHNGLSVLLQQGVIVWSRDESLACITDTLFVDLPAKQANGTALEAAGGLKVDFNMRLRYQVLGAKVQLKLNSQAEAAEFLQLRGALSDKNTPFRDVNGFRKLLLALTSTGRLAALHNGDGRLLWSRSFSQDSMPTKLLLWRGYHDIQHSPEILLLRETQPGAYAAVLNAHTGEQLWHLPLTFGIAKVIPLHAPMHEGSAVQSVYLLVEEAEAATAEAAPVLRLLPDSLPSRKHVAASERSLHFFMQGQDSRTLTGYRLAPIEDASGGVPAILSWQVNFANSVLAVAYRNPTEPIQSSVKVLSDRSIKYKYLNPNLLFVATGIANGMPLDSVAAGVDNLSNEVTVHLLDTVTGRILHRQSHPGARGPVTAVLTENAVLYYFRDIDTGRFVATSMELYDATPGRQFNVLDYLFNPNSTQPVSSLKPTPLEVQTQSFFSRLVPTAATVTQTEQGITAKQLLIVTNTDQVYALDRRWVDPRRPKKQKLSQDEMEEGLVPYQDTLPLLPLSFATLDKQVLGIRGVKVEATRLESTCLMFAHGVDLFYTRLAPAKGFDSLEDDFNYALLLAALVGLAGGAVILQYMAKQTSLNQKWK
ncbi:hypothetical protein Vretifemale_13572 [Volvox reticuliferus]|uniref:ER membrane protein complex subunit 1 n=2 Tax=Volvox reticuliferus TaxID=1737510 RepID=A0A8J4CRD9_9CHLO|nr:hypothetical protein Vretifemale_13572 [Volvox reticuliferus]